MKRYVLLGGPYDGAWTDTDNWLEPPEQLWVYRSPAGGRFGIRASVLPRDRAERYILSARLDDRNEYLHESIHSSRALRTRNLELV